MNILIVRTTPDKVNFNNVTYNRQETGLAKAFNRSGHHCDIVYFGGNDEAIIEKEYAFQKVFKIFLIKGISFMKNGIFSNFDDLISKYDIIQVGGYDQIQTWRLAKKFSNKMVIYNGTYYSAFNRGYNKKCFIIDKLFVPRYIKNKTTFITKNILSAKFLADKGISNIVPIGVGLDTDQLDILSDNKTDFSDKILQIKDEYKLLLYIGKLEARRNIHFMIKVFSEVKRLYPKTKIVMIGNGESEYINSVFDFAKELDVYDDIIWTEKLEQKFLTCIYKNCDIFLLPTLYEIFGMVLLEAMYFGLPVITSLNGGSDILIKERGTGYIIEDFDESKWADKILYLFNNIEECNDVGKKATEFISNNFTWNALSEKFISVYEDILKDN